MTAPRHVRAAPGVGWYRRRELHPDDVAVMRALRGDHVKLTATERDIAIDRLDALGYSAKTIARRIGCTDRTVLRRRNARRAAGGPAAAITQRRQEMEARWRRIAELHASGVPAAVIATRLGVSLSTVYTHREPAAA